MNPAHTGLDTDPSAPTRIPTVTPGYIAQASFVMPYPIPSAAGWAPVSAGTAHIVLGTSYGLYSSYEVTTSREITTSYEHFAGAEPSSNALAFAAPQPPEEISAEIKLSNELGEMSDLGPGWYDGDGEAINRRAIGNAKQGLSALLRKGIRYPQVVPTPEGGVKAEWIVERIARSVTFEPSGEVYVFAMNLDTRRILDGTVEPGGELSRIGELSLRVP